MREIKLIFIGIQRRKQIKTLIKRPVRFGVWLIDLIQHHDRSQSQGQSLGGDKLGLRHRAFCRIGQQNDPIGHVQYALDLTAEIGMPRRVDNIDARIVPHYRSRLGKNCNAAFFFQIA